MGEVNEKSPTFEGTVTHVLPKQVITDKFSKLEIFIEVEDGKYPIAVCLQFINDNIDLADGIKVGDLIKAETNLKGKVHNGRCFNNYTVWRVENLTSSELPESETIPDAEQTGIYYPPEAEASNIEPSGIDELPF
jgi:hypothetical protein